MRLGADILSADSAASLELLCEKLDCYGLSAIPAPKAIAEWSLDKCARFGEAAEGRDLVVGETGAWENLMTSDLDLQSARINAVRDRLEKAEAMGCRCVVVVVGSRDQSDHFLAPHPYMYTDECKAEFREVVLRILDGLDLIRTGFAVEPWHNTFFYQPEEIKAFIDTVDHPRFGVHLDQMNLVSQQSYYKTTELIERTYRLLSEHVLAVHLKDIRCDPTHMFLKWDEVFIGDGVLDYHTYLSKLSTLPEDTPCFCEHLETEAEYALNFARLHHLARKAGVEFRRRRDK